MLQLLQATASAPLQLFLSCSAAADDSARVFARAVLFAYRRDGLIYLRRSLSDRLNQLVIIRTESKAVHASVTFHLDSG